MLRLSRSATVRAPTRPPALSFDGGAKLPRLSVNQQLAYEKLLNGKAPKSFTKYNKAGDEFDKFILQCYGEDVCFCFVLPFF